MSAFFSSPNVCCVNYSIFNYKNTETYIFIYFMLSSRIIQHHRFMLSLLQASPSWNMHALLFRIKKNTSTQHFNPFQNFGDPGLFSFHHILMAIHPQSQTLKLEYIALQWSSWVHLAGIKIFNLNWEVKEETPLVSFSARISAALFLTLVLLTHLTYLFMMTYNIDFVISIIIHINLVFLCNATKIVRFMSTNETFKK